MISRGAALAVALTLTIVGCGGGDDEAAPSPTTSAAVETPTPSAEESPSDSAASPSATSSGAAEFVAVVRRELPDVFSGRTDAEIAAVATLACQSLAAGSTEDQLVGLVRFLGTLDADAADQATARKLVKLTIDTTCPEHADQVDSF